MNVKINKTSIPTTVIISSCCAIWSLLACASASLFSAKTSLLIFSNSKYFDLPYVCVIHSFSSSSASAACRSFAQRSNAVAFALLLDIPFFCKVFFAWSVASKNCPICFDKPAMDLPAAKPVLIPARIVMGSIFYLPSELMGRRVRYSNVFSSVFIRACSFTIWLNWSKKPSCVSYTSSNSW